MVTHILSHIGIDGVKPVCSLFRVEKEHFSHFSRFNGKNQGDKKGGGRNHYGLLLKKLESY